MEIRQFPCLSDNFGVFIHDPATGVTAAIDVPEEAAVRQALAQTGWRLSHVLVTHSHPDHIQGIPGLMGDLKPIVVAPRKAAAAVPEASVLVSEGDIVSVGPFRAIVREMPGHCIDHVTYHFADDKVLFAGDVLFALGCGRVFGDAYDAMWTSLARLAALPEETRVYFGHEYTLANAKFALAVDPGNAALKAQTAEAEAARDAGRATAPTTIGREKAANPFLQATRADMAVALGLAGASPAAVFRELRERKNRF